MQDLLDDDGTLEEDESDPPIVLGTSTKQPITQGCRPSKRPKNGGSKE